MKGEEEMEAKAKKEKRFELETAIYFEDNGIIKTKIILENIPTEKQEEIQKEFEKFCKSLN